MLLITDGASVTACHLPPSAAQQRYSSPKLIEKSSLNPERGTSRAIDSQCNCDPDVLCRVEFCCKHTGDESKAGRGGGCKHNEEGVLEEVVVEVTVSLLLFLVSLFSCNVPRLRLYTSTNIKVLCLQ